MSQQALYKMEKISLKRVYYTGSDTITEGFALYYDRSNITATDVNGDAILAVSSSYGRHTFVNKPSAIPSETSWFAGLVGPGESCAGPGWVNIVERDKRVHTAYVKANCVMGATVLYLYPNQYYLTNAVYGEPVAVALQTKNTSTTAATVQVFLDASLVSMATVPHGLVVPSSSVNVFSPLIWGDCPWASFMMNPLLGHTYFNDYMGNRVPLVGTSTTEISEWIQTEITSGLTAQVANVVGGALQVSSEAFASADDGLTVMYRDTSWVPNTGKRIWFEARIRMTDIDTTPDQYFIGLIDTLTDIHPSGVIDDTKDKIGFFTHSGSTAGTLEFITAKTTVEAITTGVTTGLADATWINVGFVADLLTVTPFVNGVAGTAHATAASLPTAATGLGLCIGAHGDQTSTVAAMDIDWVRIAQIR